MAELVDAHVSGACAARRAGSIPVLGTIPIEDSAGGVIHFTPPVFLFMQVWGAIIVAHPTNQGERFHKPKEKLAQSEIPVHDILHKLLNLRHENLPCILDVPSRRA